VKRHQTTSKKALFSHSAFFTFRSFHSLWMNTMNRCLSAAFAALLFAAGAQAQAQVVMREAPKDVKFAELAVSATPPVIALDGKADRLSPGARIRNTNNLLMLPASLAGKTVPVLYRRDSAGLVHEVWLLTADEARKLGGTSGGDPEGIKRFNALLAAIFGARR